MCWLRAFRTDWLRGPARLLPAVNAALVEFTNGGVQQHTQARHDGQLIACAGCSALLLQIVHRILHPTFFFRVMSILDRLPFRWRKIGVVHITAAVGIISSLKVS